MTQPMPIAEKMIKSTKVRNSAGNRIIRRLGEIAGSSKGGCADAGVRDEESGPEAGGTSKALVSLSGGSERDEGLTTVGGSGPGAATAAFRRAHGCKAFATAPGV